MQPPLHSQPLLHWLRFLIAGFLFSYHFRPKSGICFTLNELNGWTAATSSISSVSFYQIGCT